MAKPQPKPQHRGKEEAEDSKLRGTANRKASNKGENKYKTYREEEQAGYKEKAKKIFAAGKN